MLLHSHSESYECRLCAIGHGRGDLPCADRPWLESDRYVAFASVGALVPGWSLIAPKRHVLNMAFDYGEPAFADFLSRTAAIVEATYGRAVLFEHGSQGEASSTSCGTAHAHVHVVPFAGSLIANAIEFDGQLEWETCASTQVESLALGREYLFAADGFEVGCVGRLAILTEGRSQFFRQVIATALGRALEFNYRTHPHLEVAEATAATLRRSQERRAETV